jgi:hypothetical protein
VFINRDGDLFAYVMQFLRDGKQTVLPEDSNTLRRLTVTHMHIGHKLERWKLVEGGRIIGKSRIIASEIHYPKRACPRAWKKIFR